MFETQRRNIGNYFLKKELKGKTRAVVANNFANLRKVGIVFKVEDENDFKEIKGYVRYFREEGIKMVKAVGYFEGKENPHYLIPSLDFDFINKKDLNWYFKPSGTVAENFITEDFDVLINMVKGECFPMKYLLATTSARMKIGRYSDEEQDLYDLMIQAEEAKNLKYFMEQVNHYLHILNKPTTNVE